jgi:phosphoesterase RecJ-like protein
MLLDKEIDNLDIEIYQRLLASKRVLIVSHVNPDGDALASMAAMIDILESFSKPRFAYAHNKQSTNFYFLPHEEEISGSWPEGFKLSDFDMMVAVDCGSLSRTNLENEVKSLSDAERRQIFIVEIDHHPAIDDYADVVIRLPEKASTTEVIYGFLKSNKHIINKGLADCILTGILTDTANFLYPSASDETISIASEMMGYGARFGKIMQSTWKNKSWLSMKVMALALDSLSINNRYGIAVSVVAFDDLRRAGLGEFLDPENIQLLNEVYNEAVAFLSNLGGVKAVLLLRESEPGQLKGSWRSSSPDIDVSILARHLGGGGHSKAAGFSFSGSVIRINGGWKII